MTGTVTVKSVALVAVPSVTATVIGPVVAPDGTSVTIVVAVLDVIVAVVPLNVTVLLDGAISKFVPVIVTVVPTGPLIGVKLVIVGGCVTVKSVALVAVLPDTLTVIGPVVAPVGTVVTILVVVFEVMEANVPLKRTSFNEEMVLKFVPVIVTEVPSGPIAGVKVVMVGGGGAVMTKSVELVAVFVPTLTVITPVVAPAGTVVVILVEVLDDTEVTVPLNRTVLSEGVGLKFVPVITTVFPANPLVGLKLVMVGGGNVTTKLVALVAVLLPTFTVITPVVAPAGTVVSILVAVLAVTVARVPLNRTSLSPGLVLKFVPVIVTGVPTNPLVGVKLVMVGGGSVTVKLPELVAVFPPIKTLIVPVVAPTGTVVLILVVVLDDTVASVPLKRTSLLPGVLLKFVPVISTGVPTGPLIGLKLVIVGGKVTTKFDELVAVLPFTFTVINPVVADAGTTASIVVAELDDTVANTPLNFTSLKEGVVLKFVPVIETKIPDGPLPGVNPVIVGVGPHRGGVDTFNFSRNKSLNEAEAEVRLITQLPGSKSIVPRKFPVA